MSTRSGASWRIPMRAREEEAPVNINIPPALEYRSPSPNRFGYVRITVLDLDKAQAFFSSVFGWTFTEPQSDPECLRFFFTGGEVVGQLYLVENPRVLEVESSWSRVLSHIIVDDVRETLKKVVDHGGTITMNMNGQGEHAGAAQFVFEGSELGLLCKCVMDSRTQAEVHGT